MQLLTLTASLALISSINALPTFNYLNKLFQFSNINNENDLTYLNEQENDGFHVYPPNDLFNDYIDETEYNKLPEIETEQLQKLINEQGLQSRAEDLFKIAQESSEEYGHPTRVIASKGHWGTVNYILSEIRKLGGYYNVKTQSFDALDGKVNSFSLLIDGVKPKSLKALALTPPTANNSLVHGNLVLVDNLGCDPSDYPQSSKNNIVLIKRGQCAFGDKSRNAGIAGALGAIVYDEKEIQATLGEPKGHEVATVSVAEKDVKEYIEKLAKNPEIQIETSLYVDSYIKKIKTLNVIAETVFGDHDNVVALGAHSDSVAAGPGINDDGSGTISLLETAKYLTQFKINNAVRFAWWAAEEEGLLGSTYYANSLSPSENSKLRLFMDYDMMASPNYEYEIYAANNKDHPNGSGTLTDLYIDWYKAHNLNYTFVPFDGRSDYVGFIDNGIPSSGVCTGAEGVKNETSKAKFGGEAGKWFDPCYHQLCDDLSNPDYTAWVLNTKLIAHSVAVYAKSLESFPKREPNQVKAVSKHEDEFIYRGANLIM